MSERARAAESAAAVVPTDAVSEAAASAASAASAAEAPPSLEEYLAPQVPEPVVVTGLRSAELVSITDQGAEVRLRGERRASLARVDEAVDRQLLKLALHNGDRVLVEGFEGERFVVGVLQVRLPKRIELRASEVVIEAEDEVSLRAGRAGARLRKDGDVEIVGSRISAVSRGLFKIVGRVLRLN